MQECSSKTDFDVYNLLENQPEQEVVHKDEFGDLKFTAPKPEVPVWEEPKEKIDQSQMINLDDILN
jgi:hypothetical protein